MTADIDVKKDRYYGITLSLGSDSPAAQLHFVIVSLKNQKLSEAINTHCEMTELDYGRYTEVTDCQDLGAADGASEFVDGDDPENAPIDRANILKAIEQLSGLYDTLRDNVSEAEARVLFGFTDEDFDVPVGTVIKSVQVPDKGYVKIKRNQWRLLDRPDETLNINDELLSYTTRRSADYVRV